MECCGEYAMLTATEQQVKMAAQLYEMRDKARWLLGDKYKPHMAKFLQLVPFAVDQIGSETERSGAA